MEFELNGEEYIELNRLLKILGLAETGGDANNRITGGEVQVNEKTEIQKRKKLRAGDRVLFNGNSIIVI